MTKVLTSVTIQVDHKMVKTRGEEVRPMAKIRLKPVKPIVWSIRIAN